MLRRLNRVAPAKQPSPVDEFYAILLHGTEEELVALRAILLRVNEAGSEHSADRPPELKRLRALATSIEARHAKAINAEKQIDSKKPTDRKKARRKAGRRRPAS
jgi:hypothetical protein